MRLSIRQMLSFLAVLMLIFSAGSASFCVFADTKSEARSAIAAAEEKIVVCYEAVADTNKVGANSTGLFVVLNEAGELLSKANLAYKKGDYDSAFDFALKSQERLNGFVEEANVLRRIAIQQRYTDSLVNVAGSIVGTIVLICGSFVTWLFLKRKHEKARSVVQ